MSLAVLLDAPYFTGASTSAEVPGRYDVSLAGRGYMIDLDEKNPQFTRASIPLLRNQADTGGSPGEQSLSPEELWRRSASSWDHGAGQTYADREGSDPARFRSSKGMDVWERWALKLLPDTASKRTSANTNLALITAGTYLYLTDGTSLLYTQSLSGTPTWTAVTGGPAPASSSLASNGFDVWTAHAASGVYKTTRGAATTASYATGTVSLVGYVKGRLMAANANSLYNITAAGALPAALYTQPNTDFVWVGFAEGNTSIYAAGYSGDKSLIYRTAVKADGTALDIPVVAGELPDGEIVRSVQGYLGFLLVGTDKGVRFCSADTSGNLTIGSLTPTASAVNCFEGQEKYVWFGWTNYDTVSTGLGRMDLSTFIFPLTPAYASDLMATGQGAVLSVQTFTNLRVFAVSGVGVFAEGTTKVPSGTLSSGLITYGIPDTKVSVFLDIRLRSSAGTHGASVSADSAAFASVGTRTVSSTDPFQVGQTSGETFEVRTELARSATDTTTGPIVTRVTLRSYPRPRRGEVFTVPLLLHEQMVDRTDSTIAINPANELATLLTLQASRALFTYQVGVASYTVLLDDSQFTYSHRTQDGKGWNGTLLVRLKALAQ